MPSVPIVPTYRCTDCTDCTGTDCAYCTECLTCIRDKYFLPALPVTLKNWVGLESHVSSGLSNLLRTSAHSLFGHPDIEKHMKARDRRPSAFIDLLHYREETRSTSYCYSLNEWPTILFIVVRSWFLYSLSVKYNLVIWWETLRFTPKETHYYKKCWGRQLFIKKTVQIVFMAWGICDLKCIPPADGHIRPERVGTYARYLGDCIWVFVTFLAWYCRMDLSTLGLGSRLNCTNFWCWKFTRC